MIRGLKPKKRFPESAAPRGPHARTRASMASALQKAINASIASGAHHFVAAPPTDAYYFDSAPLIFAGAQDFLFDGSGATFWFRLGAGVLLTQCSNVTLRNLTIDYPPGAVLSSRHGVGRRKGARPRGPPVRPLRLRQSPQTARGIAPDGREDGAEPLPPVRPLRLARAARRPEGPMWPRPRRVRRSESTAAGSCPLPAAAGPQLHVGKSSGPPGRPRSRATASYRSPSSIRLTRWHEQRACHTRQTIAATMCPSRSRPRLTG